MASPSAATTPSLARVHVVMEGQLLIFLAKRYHVDVDNLREANRLAPGQTLKIGTRLMIPAPSDSVVKVTAVAYHPPAKDPVSPSSPPLAPLAPLAPLPRGQVRVARGGEGWQGRLGDGHGRLSGAAVEAFSRLLRFAPTGKRRAMEPRLLALLGRVSDHFGGRTLRIVSGFRPVSPRQFTPHSRHNVGAAADFSVEGVSNDAVRDFCRTLPNVGVGYYPNSSFVHLDARATTTTWVDYSRPGEAPRYDHAHGPRDADESTADVTADTE